MTAILAHGASVTVSSTGVQVERTAMGQTLLPKELTFTPEELRGWYRQEPTATSPGWIQFSLAHPPADAALRPLRGYPALHGVSNVVAFAPGQTEEFFAVDGALTALQAGYPPETVDAASSKIEGDSAGELTDTAGASALAKAPEDALFDIPDHGVKTSEASAASSKAKSKKSRSGSGRQDGWRRISTPETVPDPDLTADADGPVFGQNVTVTGDFEPYGKDEVWEMIAAAGGTIGKNVTKKTTLLILGTWQSVTSKEKRARELQEKGQGIEIWTFEELLARLGKTPRPDFSEVQGTDAPF